MRANAEQAPPAKRGAFLAGRSSVYPHRALRYIAAADQPRRPCGPDKKFESRHAPYLQEVSKQETQDQPFPRERLAAVAAWLADDESSSLFAEIDSLCARVRGIRSKAEGNQFSGEVLSELPASLHALAYGTDARSVSPQVESTPNYLSHIELSNSASVHSSLPHAEAPEENTVIHISVCSDSPRVEPSPHGSPNIYSLQQNSPRVDSPATSSSVGNRAVSLRDASPLRPCEEQSAVKLYDVVQISQPHHILAQINFSAW